MRMISPSILGSSYWFGKILNHVSKNNFVTAQTFVTIFNYTASTLMPKNDYLLELGV